MYVQKPGRISGGKTTPEKAANNVSTSKISTPNIKTSISAAGNRSISSLISSLGMPQDKLSASILSFARFFSLPLKPQLLADIRSQAFSQPSAEQPLSDSVKQLAAEKIQDPSVTGKNRETFSLAAAAAEGKGVGLDNKGLESYAKAIDPDWQDRQDHSRKDSGQRRKDDNEQKDESKPLKVALIDREIASIDPSNLEKTALEYLEKDPLLSILNKMPGKNGQRWIVIPFEFNENGRQFRVSMRVLLNAEHAVSNHSSFMALDIAETGEQKNHWLFVLESASSQTMRLSVYTQAELPAKIKADYERELSKLLGIPVERISFKKYIDSFPFESGFGEELLNQIDKAV